MSWLNGRLQACKSPLYIGVEYKKIWSNRKIKIEDAENFKDVKSLS